MEKDSNINNPNDWKHAGTKLTSVQLALPLWRLAKTNIINFKDALEFGITFKLAEKGIYEFPENELTRRLERVTTKLNEKCQEIEDLKSGGKTAEDEVDELFDEIKGEVEKDE